MAQQECRGRGKSAQGGVSCTQRKRVTGCFAAGRAGWSSAYKERCTVVARVAWPLDQLRTAGLTVPSKSWPVARDAELCPRSVSLPLFPLASPCLAPPEVCTTRRPKPLCSHQRPRPHLPVQSPCLASTANFVPCATHVAACRHQTHKVRKRACLKVRTDVGTAVVACECSRRPPACSRAILPVRNTKSKQHTSVNPGLCFHPPTRHTCSAKHAQLHVQLQQSKGPDHRRHAGGSWARWLVGQQMINETKREPQAKNTAQDPLSPRRPHPGDDNVMSHYYCSTTPLLRLCSP